MAKRAKVDSDLFAKTETKKSKEKAEDFVKARGVGLKSSEWAEFDKVAQELGMKPHALRVYAMRYFMQHYKAGNIQTKTEKVTSLPSFD